MGQNRALGSVYHPEVIVTAPGVTTTIQTNHVVDMYGIATISTASSPVQVNLDPLAVNGDVVTIKDVGGHAATNNITITPSGTQIIAGHSSIVLNQNGAVVELVFTIGLNYNVGENESGAWMVRSLLNVAAAPQ